MPDSAPEEVPLETNTAEIKRAAKQSANPLRSVFAEEWQASFAALLQNRGKTQPDYGPARDRGFVVLVREPVSLQPLEAVCLDERQTWNSNCLTFRYRIARGATFANLLAAFADDARRVVRGEQEARGVVRMRGGGLESARDQVEKLVSELASYESGTSDTQDRPERGTLEDEWVEALLRGIETGTTTGQRVVLFAELADPSEDGAAWQAARGALLDRLPGRMGIVLSGAPAHFEIPAGAAHLLELEIPEARRAGPEESVEALAYTAGGLRSDRPAEVDRLGRAAYARALADFVLHPRTQPLTLGIHGPWGMGKSSFMGFVERELLVGAGEDAGEHASQLAALRAAESRRAEVEREPPESAGRSRRLAEARSQVVRARERLVAAASSRTVVCQFNAWQFQDSRQIWAGLAAEVTGALERPLSAWDKLRLRVLYAWRTRRAGILLGAALLIVAVALAVWLVDAYEPQLEREPVAGDGLVRVATTGALGPLLAGGGSLLVLLGLLAWRTYRVLQPVSRRILEYGKLPTYRQQMGYQHEVMGDIRVLLEVLEGLGRRPRVVVFIDDLDRCGEDKIMDVLQAINLVLGGLDFYVFLGMDTEMIHRAIRSHYEKDLEVDLRELDQDFAAKYLEKIVQLSFHLPQPSDPEQEVFLGSLFSESSRGGPEGGGESEPAEAAVALGEGTLDLRFDLAAAERPVHREVVPVEDTPEELAVFRRLGRYTEDNPREVKRLVNTHRLVKILLQQHDASWPEARQERLVKWVVFCTAWPRLVGPLLAAAGRAAAGDDEADRDLLAEHAGRVGDRDLAAFAAEPPRITFGDLAGSADFRLAARYSRLLGAP